MQNKGFNLLSFFLRIDRAFSTLLEEHSEGQREIIYKKSVCEFEVNDGNIDELHDLVKLLVRSTVTGDMGEVKRVMVTHNIAFNHLLDFMASFSYLKDEGGFTYDIEREFASCGYMLYGITPEDLININFGEAA